MVNSLKEKVVLITGGSYGIGYGIAESLLQMGCKVAITSRKSSSARSAAEALSASSGGSVTGIKADVRSMEEMIQAVDEVLEIFGRLDVLVANAGIGHFVPIDELTNEQWHDTINTNLNGVFHSVKAAIPALKLSKGYIITIASLAGTNFFAKAAAYNASKFGLVGFSQAIMLDLRPYEIKVSTIMPGSVATYFAGHEPNDADGWKIQPQDIGQLVVDLLKMNPRTLPSKIEVRPSQTS